MKTILIFFILISHPSLASELWIGGDYGQGSYSLDNNSQITDNNIFGVKLYNQPKPWLKTGLGYQRQELGLKFSQGIYQEANLVSNNLYLYLTPSFKLSSSFFLNFDNKILLNNPLQTGMDSSQRFFSGIGLGYELNRNYRIVATVSKGLDLGDSTTLALVSLEINLNPKKKKVSTPKVVLKEKRVLPVYQSKYVKIGALAGNFGYKKSDPLDSAWLNNLVGLLKQSSYKEILLIGHTDKVGNQEYNLKLGLERAEFIKKYLIDQGLKENILTDSKGKMEPISPIDESLNRRVEIFIEMDMNLPINKPLVNFLQGDNNEK